MLSLIKNYQNLQDKIISIATTLNRADKIRLIAVSKTFPANDIRELFSLGQIAFAENYAQELCLKAKELSNLAIEWHFIGKIQSNKTKLIAKYANWVHGLENPKHAIRLNNDRPITLPKLNVLIEVNISGDPGRHGLTTIDKIQDLIAIINQQQNLVFRGLMGVASATNDLHLTQNQFYKLNQLFKQIQQLLHSNNIDTLSMGMSGDYPIAIECGTTMLRIGSLIFGDRSSINT